MPPLTKARAVAGCSGTLQSTTRSLESPTSRKQNHNRRPATDPNQTPGGTAHPWPAGALHRPGHPLVHVQPFLTPAAPRCWATEPATVLWPSRTDLSLQPRTKLRHSVPTAATNFNGGPPARKKENAHQRPSTPSPESGSRCFDEAVPRRGGRTSRPGATRGGSPNSHVQLAPVANIQSGAYRPTEQVSGRSDTWITHMSFTTLHAC